MRFLDEGERVRRRIIWRIALFFGGRKKLRLFLILNGLRLTSSWHFCAPIELGFGLLYVETIWANFEVKNRPFLSESCGERLITVRFPKGLLLFTMVYLVS